jgi:hypothetical protein
MMSEQHHGAHSALLEMRLIVNGESLSITHMGPDFLIVKSSGEHPPGEAAIVLPVDQGNKPRAFQARLRFCSSNASAASSPRPPQ